MDSSELKDHLESLHRESYGWALSCCFRNHSDAEVVLQTVYLKILEGKARFDGKASLKTWLFSVIRRTAADERRRRLLRRFRLGKYQEDAMRASVTPHPDEAIYQSEVQSLLEPALAALPKRQCEVLQLVFYHGLSLAEAAGAMGVSIGSARTHYERGKKRLRQSISEGIFDESGTRRKNSRGDVPTVEA